MVTAFAHRYRYDLFFRTELNIIALQLAFSILLLGTVVLGLSFLFRSAAHDMVSAIAGSVKVTLRESAETIIRSQLDFIRTRSFLIVASAIVPITVLFGYLIARITLIPTRNALSSQKQFIGNVAHELRTPLSIIKTNTEVRLLDKDVPPVARELHRSNIEELDRISDIINNLLSLNTLNRPAEMDFKNVDLGEVAHSVVQKVQPLLERRKLTLVYTGGDYRLVWGNRSALEQILMNIVKNSISYSKSGGRIDVSIAPDYRSHVVLKVSDTGVGIGKSDLLHIFEPFFRADRSRVREHGGSGLGLTIVSELVKLHDGKITIKSVPRLGTTVAVVLPCGKADGPSAEVRRPLNEISLDFSGNSAQRTS